MIRGTWRIVAASAIVVGAAFVPDPAAAQPAVADTGATRAAVAPAYVVPRTPDGHPDLQGVWDYRTATPLERPAQFKDTPFLTDEDVAEYERRAATRPDGRPPDDPRTDPSVQSPDWLDYGKTVVRTRRSSLVIDPPDGRIPPLTPGAQARAAARRDARQNVGPADDPEVRSTWERCITRGLPEGVLPAGYNNNIQIIQTSQYVVLLMEMIHDARIVPLDGRPHLPSGTGQWMGDSRARWDGNTLVVETANFSDRSNFRGSADKLRLVERLTRTSATTITYQFTVEDPTTWTRPWTVEIPLELSDGLVYEYACHEGNHGLRNILSQARSSERRAAASKR